MKWYFWMKNSWKSLNLFYWDCILFNYWSLIPVVPEDKEKLEETFPKLAPSTYDLKDFLLHPSFSMHRCPGDAFFTPVTHI